MLLMRPFVSRTRLCSRQSLRNSTSNQSPRFSTRSEIMNRFSSINKRQKATLVSNFSRQARLNRIEEQDSRTIMEEINAFLNIPRTIPIPRWMSPRHHTIALSECLGHSSFILVAISYAVDDFLMLRIIAVAGSTAMLFFTYFHPHGRVLWLPFKWNLLFIALNAYRILKTFRDEYLAKTLPEELLELHKNNFYLMNSVDFYRLVQCAKIKTYKKGDLIINQGECNPYVRMVLSGQFKVFRDGKLIYMLEEGNFISEAGLHAGLLLPGKMESACAVVADTDVRVLAWDRTSLVDLLHQNPELRRALKAALSWDLVRKLKDQRRLLKSGIIDNTEEWTERSIATTRHRYAAILHSMTQHPSILKENKKELDKYRHIHHIDDSTNDEALRLLGWTRQEFELGHRKHEGSGDDHIEEDTYRRDFFWYLRTLVYRMVR